MSHYATHWTVILLLVYTLNFIIGETIINTPTTNGLLALVYEDSPYLFEVSHTVTEKLTVEAGVVAMFNIGCSLIVDELEVYGNETHPVLFTSSTTTPSNDDWEGLLVNSRAHLEYFTMEYATREGDGAIAFVNEANMYDSTVRNTNGQAVRATATDLSQLTLLRNNILAGSGSVGVGFTSGESFYNVDISNCTIVGGIFVDNALQCSITSNTITAQLTAGVSIVGYVDQLDISDNNISAKDALDVKGDCLSQSSTTYITDNRMNGRVELTRIGGCITNEVKYNVISDAVSTTSMFVLNTDLENLVVESNVISNCTADQSSIMNLLSTGTNVVFENNTIDSCQAKYALMFITAYPLSPHIKQFRRSVVQYFTGTTVIYINANDWQITDNEFKQNFVTNFVESGGSFAETSLPYNYWGEDLFESIRAAILDAMKTPSSSFIDFSPYKTQSGELMVEENEFIINSTMEWTVPKYLSGTVFIRKSHKLSITADVSMGSQVNILCNGRLEIVGENGPIRIAASGQGDSWGGIFYLDSAEMSSTDASYQYVSGSVIQNVNIEGTTSGIVVYGSGSLVMEYLNMTTTSLALSGYSFGNSFPPIIRNSYFKCSASNFQFELIGPAVITDSVFVGHNLISLNGGYLTIIANNTFEATGTALWLSSPIFDVSVSGNTFKNGATGLYISSPSSGGLAVTTSKNTFMNLQTAISYGGTDFSCGVNPYVLSFTENDFYGTGANIISIDATQSQTLIAKCAIGFVNNNFQSVRAVNQLIKVKAIGTYFYENNFNTSSDASKIVSYELSSTYSALNFSYNDFGTVSRDTIDSFIIDGLDDTNLAIVNYNPVYDSELEMYFDFVQNCYLDESDGSCKFNCTDPVTGAYSCNENSYCTFGDVCQCFDGYSGTQCTPICNGLFNNDTRVCSGRGNCTSPNSCNCDTDYYGTDCEFYYCYGLLNTDINVCSGLGTCNGPDNCTCTSSTTNPNCIAYYLEVVYNSTGDACSDETIQAQVIDGPATVTAVDCYWGLIGPSTENQDLRQYVSGVATSLLVIPRNYLVFGKNYSLQVECQYNTDYISKFFDISIEDVNIEIDGPDTMSKYSEVILTFEVDIQCFTAYEWNMYSQSGEQVALPATTYSFYIPTGLEYGEYIVQLTIFYDTRQVSRNKTITVVGGAPTVFIDPELTSVLIGSTTIFEANAVNPDGGLDDTYQWTCLSLNTSTCPDTVTTTSLYTFAPAEPGFYVISVVYSVFSGQSASDSITIEAIQSSIKVPNVTIVTKLAPFISQSQKLVVEANIEPVADRAQIRQSWSLVLDGQSTDLLRRNRLLTSTQARIVAFIPSDLVIGSTYTLTINASYIGRTEYVIAQVSFAIAPAITAGVLTVHPSAGNQLDTVFSFTASSWATDSAALPLLYTFEYLNSKGIFVPFKPAQESPIFSTRLIANPSNITQIRCRVRNKYGSEASVMQSVTVSSTKVDASTLIEALIRDITLDNSYQLIMAATLAVRDSKNSSAVSSVLSALQALNNTNSVDIVSQQSEVLLIATQDTSILDTATKLQSIQLTNSVLSVAVTLAAESDVSQKVGSIIASIATSDSPTKEINDECIVAMGGLSSLLLNSIVSGENATTVATEAFSLSVVKNFAPDLATQYGVSNDNIIIVTPRIARFENDTDTEVSAELIEFNGTDSVFWSNRTENITSSVVSFRLLDANNSKYQMEFDQEDPLVIILTRTAFVENETIVCKYLDDFSSTERWSTKGCWLHLATETQIICHCNHTTSFAAFTLFSDEDGSIKPSVLQRTVYYVSVSIYSIYLLLSIAILITLIVFHRNRPVRSRLFAPYICLFAIIVECVLLVIRNGLWIAEKPDIDAINIVGYVIMFISNPLSIVSLFIFLWQMIRFILLQQSSRIMSTDMGKLNNDAKLRVYKVFSSKLVFIVLALVIYSVSFVYFLIYSIIAMSLKMSERALDASTITLAVTYSGVIVVIGIAIVVVFLFDVLIVPFHQRKYRQKQKAAMQQAEMEEEDIQDSDVKRKKDEYIQQIASPLRTFFISDDPLGFRINSTIMVLSIVAMFVSYAIGIANHVSLDRSDNSPLMIVALIFDLIYTLLRIIAYGGFVALYSLIDKFSTNSNRFSEFVNNHRLEDKEDQEINIMNLIEVVINNKVGYESFKEFCTIEMSVENLLIWTTLKSMSLEWLVTSNEGRKQMMEALVNRFVRSNSPLEVNLPSSVRKAVLAMTKNLDNTSVNEQMQTLHKLSVSVLTNLSDTFSRFSETKEYHQFIEYFAMHKVLEDILGDNQPKIQWFSYNLMN